MGKINDETVNYAVPIIIPVLGPAIIYSRYAALALGEMGSEASVTELENLRDDTSRIKIYEDGELNEKSVVNWHQDL